jgi:uncharacterized protein (DUF1330 family)
VTKSAFWVIAWRSVSDAAAVERYAATAGAAIRAHGGRILARGDPARTYEAGVSERLVVVRFEDLPAAISAYESPEYQAAVAHLAGAAVRDVRIIESVE